MTLRLVFVALAMTARIAGAQPAAAEPPHWLELHVPASCAIDRSDLAIDVERALVGPRARWPTRARVSIWSARDGFYVAIELWQGEVPAGFKRLIAPTCDEARRATVIVLAQALAVTDHDAEPDSTGPRSVESSAAEPRHASPGLEEPAVARDHNAARSVMTAPHATDPIADTPRPCAPLRSRFAGSKYHVSLLGGLEAGSVPNTVPYVEGRVGWDHERFSLRSAVRFGAPQEVTEVDSEADPQRETRRTTFATFDLSACFGSKSAWRLLGCLGGEAGVARTIGEQEQGGVITSIERTEPLLAGLLVAVLTYREAVVQPLFEVGGTAVALGPEDQGSFGFRIAGGAAIAF
jgi:hypothetical protein